MRRRRHLTLSFTGPPAPFPKATSLIMSTPFSIRLPVEVWLHILSFIPGGMEIRRLIGLNHIFFEAAMNDIFREVIFVPSDNSGCNLKRLTQIREPSIGHRIRSLYVRPPTIELGPPRAGVLSSLKNIIYHSHRSIRRKKRNNAILKALYLAIPNCKNVRELTLHHEAGFATKDTPSPVFLQNMWSVVGPNLRKLRIISPWERLSLLLEEKATLPVTNLEELSITFILLRSFENVPWSPVPILTSRSFIAFAQSQRHSLQSLTISSFERLEMSSYFEELGYFPRLKQLRILVMMDRHTLPQPSSLTRFLDMHKDTLETIGIIPKIERMDETYRTWISGEFTTLEFPALQSLKIGSWGFAFPHVPRLTLVSLNVRHPSYIRSVKRELERASGNRKISKIRHITNTDLEVELVPPAEQRVPHNFRSCFYDK
ncbi:hypothetical protein BDZ94DRAFT_972268 [Collybia nuda]|uniref:F-box domain-containing protein n=1 Tax=Collybia nuda TaxID=64659 RepID=A0A9P5YFC0_9AGAR|nr:hypothetical protein BDZ94DRAFT_972268 [Collybia nuda]